MSDGAPKPRLADRLRNVRVSIRDDLTVTRHVLRGEPAYVVRDPLTFESHRFDAEDYAVFVSIDAARTLGETFDALVEQGRCGREAEEAFYQFVFGLHRLGFLQLPVADDAALYRRFSTRRDARNRQWATAFMSLKMPVCNPDEFLQRTLGFFRPLFTTTAFVLWLGLMLTAGVALYANWGRLHEPLAGVLTAGNLPLMWVTLIVLKTIHEFGHAYACRAFGAAVPEMGVILIFGTPCAYVDATASWSISSKRRRIIICLAGMYFESVAAALAVFVWAASGPGVLSSAAYNAMFLASVTTVLFNINPLMRYDGYYVLADLLEIPNLRQRATQFCTDLLKRVFVGVRLTHAAPTDLRLGATLLSFGVCAGVYRVVLIFAIIAIIASKLYLVGLLLGCLVAAGTLWKIGSKVFGYLWFAAETAPVRTRAVALSAALLLGVPAALLLIPVQTGVSASGVLGRAEELVVRAQTPGFVSSVQAEIGAPADRDAPLVVLENPEEQEALQVARGAARIAELRRDAALAVSTAAAAPLDQRVEAARAAANEQARRIAALEVRAPRDGDVLSALRPTEEGRYLHVGDAVATIAAGEWIVRALLSEDQTAAAEPRVGDRVEFRSAADPSSACFGVIERVTPSGSNRIAHPALTHLGGGPIAVNPAGAGSGASAAGSSAAGAGAHPAGAGGVSPASAIATQPYFEITVRIEPADGAVLAHGMTGRVRLSARSEPVGLHLFRRAVRFLDGLRTS
ncbi:MAG: HlyD family efflux transporter periplasmic adaptor subunit [Phycisphaerales bacterium]|nr:HlyD family efflux transporter periplasmic adaptor subunit [Phycisphaerales bacterium]